LKFLKKYSFGTILGDELVPSASEKALGESEKKF
jgi:hypothetical protein